VWRGRSKSSNRRARLHHHALVHHHHLISEGERLGLIVRHVDHGGVQALVQLLELGAQAPFQVGIDHRQGLVEQDRVHVGAHQAAAERDLLLAVGREPGGALIERGPQVQHRGDLAHPGVH